jgi:hypothetical protein
MGKYNKLCHQGSVVVEDFQEYPSILMELFDLNSNRLRNLLLFARSTKNSLAVKRPSPELSGSIVLLGAYRRDG